MFGNLEQGTTIRNDEVATIEAIQDIDRPEALGERILDPGIRD